MQRAHASFIALLRDSKGATNVATLESAGTVDIGGANSYAVDIAGAVTITSFGANYNGPRYVRFTGALTLTHNATLLALPGAANITTAAGDSLIATPNSTGNGWNVTSYQRAATAPDFATNASVAAAIAALILVPAGTVMHTAASTAPTGYIKANGNAVSRTTYAALFGAIGTIYGAGDGSTTFNVPDLRGEFVRGWDDARGVDAGRANGSSQGDAIRNIIGGLTSSLSQHYYGLTGTGAIQTTNPGGTGVRAYIDEPGTLSATFDASRVVPTANENRPRNLALLACIKY